MHKRRRKARNHYRSKDRHRRGKERKKEKEQKQKETENEERERRDKERKDQMPRMGTSQTNTRASGKRAKASEETTGKGSKEHRSTKQRKRKGSGNTVKQRRVLGNPAKKQPLPNHLHRRHPRRRKRKSECGSAAEKHTRTSTRQGAARSTNGRIK